MLLALCVVAGIAAGDAAAKKKHKASVFSASVTANLAIPDRPPANAAETPIASTLTVGKKFKGKQVGDVNVTGIRTTGSDTNAAQDLNLSISAPNGRTVLLVDDALGGQNIGPLTLDDDTATEICNATTPTCRDPDATLLQPFAGTANLTSLGSGGLSPLSSLNGSPMKGTWTFRAWDDSNNNKTSVLNTWGLQITALRPVTK